ncbi:MAG: hypothetical protein ACRDSG_03715, partial [Pseudonocardiaceae bacterium]
MRRKHNRRAGHNLALNDRAAHPVRPALQPFTCRNEPRGIVPLLGSAGTALHDAQRQSRHISVQPRQFG